MGNTICNELFTKEELKNTWKRTYSEIMGTRILFVKDNKNLIDSMNYDKKKIAKVLNFEEKKGRIRLRRYKKELDKLKIFLSESCIKDPEFELNEEKLLKEIPISNPCEELFSQKLKIAYIIHSWILHCTETIKEDMNKDKKIDEELIENVFSAFETTDAQGFKNKLLMTTFEFFISDADHILDFKDQQKFDQFLKHLDLILDSLKKDQSFKKYDQISKKITHDLKKICESMIKILNSPEIFKTRKLLTAFLNSTLRLTFFLGSIKFHFLLLKIFKDSRSFDNLGISYPEELKEVNLHKMPLITISKSTNLKFVLKESNGEKLNNISSSDDCRNYYINKTPTNIFLQDRNRLFTFPSVPDMNSITAIKRIDTGIHLFYYKGEIHGRDGSLIGPYNFNENIITPKLKMDYYSNFREEAICCGNINKLRKKFSFSRNYSHHFFVKDFKNAVALKLYYNENYDSSKPESINRICTVVYNIYRPGGGGYTNIVKETAVTFNGEVFTQWENEMVNYQPFCIGEDDDYVGLRSRHHVVILDVERAEIVSFKKFGQNYDWFHGVDLRKKKAFVFDFRSKSLEIREADDCLESNLALYFRLKKKKILDEKAIQSNTLMGDMGVSEMKEQTSDDSSEEESEDGDIYEIAEKTQNSVKEPLNKKTTPSYELEQLYYSYIDFLMRTLISVKVSEDDFDFIGDTSNDIVEKKKNYLRSFLYYHNSIENSQEVYELFSNLLKNLKNCKRNFDSSFLMLVLLALKKNLERVAKLIKNSKNSNILGKKLIRKITRSVEKLKVDEKHLGNGFKSFKKTKKNLLKMLKELSSEEDEVGHEVAEIKELVSQKLETVTFYNIRQKIFELKYEEEADEISEDDQPVEKIKPNWNANFEELFDFFIEKSGFYVSKEKTNFYEIIIKEKNLDHQTQSDTIHKRNLIVLFNSLISLDLKEARIPQKLNDFIYTNLQEIEFVVSRIREELILTIEELKKNNKHKEQLRIFDSYFKESILGNLISMLSAFVAYGDEPIFPEKVLTKLKETSLKFIQFINTFGNALEYSELREESGDIEQIVNLKKQGNKNEQTIKIINLSTKIDKKFTIKIEESCFDNFREGTSVLVFRVEDFEDAKRDVLIHVFSLFNLKEEIKGVYGEEFRLVLLDSGRSKTEDIKVAFTHRNNEIPSSTLSFVSLAKTLVLQLIEDCKNKIKNVREVDIFSSFEKRDQKYVEEILSSDIFANGTNESQFRTYDYDMDVSTLTKEAIAREYRDNVLMSQEMFGEAKTNYENFCESLQAILSTQDPSIRVGGEAATMSVMTVFLVCLKHRKQFELIKTGLQYGGVDPSFEWLQLWRRCSSIRKNVREFSPNELKQMFRKIKLLLVMESDPFGFGGQDQISTLYSMPPKTQASVSTLKSELIRQTHRQQEDEDKVTSGVTSFLKSSCEVDTIFQILNQRQIAFESTNQAFEVIDKIMLNSHDSVLADVIYSSFKTIFRLTGETLTELTTSYSGVPTYLTGFQFTSLKDILKRYIDFAAFANNPPSIKILALDNLKWIFNNNEHLIMRCIDLVKLWDHNSGKNENSKILDSLIEISEIISNFYLRKSPDRNNNSEPADPESLAMGVVGIIETAMNELNKIKEKMVKSHSFELEVYNELDLGMVNSNKIIHDQFWQNMTCHLIYARNTEITTIKEYYKKHFKYLLEFNTLNNKEMKEVTVQYYIRKKYEGNSGTTQAEIEGYTSGAVSGSALGTSRAEKVKSAHPVLEKKYIKENPNFFVKFKNTVFSLKSQTGMTKRVRRLEKLLGVLYKLLVIKGEEIVMLLNQEVYKDLIAFFAFNTAPKRLQILCQRILLKLAEYVSLDKVYENFENIVEKICEKIEEYFDKKEFEDYIFNLETFLVKFLGIKNSKNMSIEILKKLLESKNQKIKNFAFDIFNYKSRKELSLVEGSEIRIKGDPSNRIYIVLPNSLEFYQKASLEIENDQIIDYSNFPKDKAITNNGMIYSLIPVLCKTTKLVEFVHYDNIDPLPLRINPKIFSENLQELKIFEKIGEFSVWDNCFNAYNLVKFVNYVSGEILLDEMKEFKTKVEKIELPYEVKTELFDNANINKCNLYDKEPQLKGEIPLEPEKSFIKSDRKNKFEELRKKIFKKKSEKSKMKIEGDNRISVYKKPNMSHNVKYLNLGYDDPFTQILIKSKLKKFMKENYNKGEKLEMKELVGLCDWKIKKYLKNNIMNEEQALEFIEELSRQIQANFEDYENFRGIEQKKFVDLLIKISKIEIFRNNFIHKFSEVFLMVITTGLRLSNTEPDYKKNYFSMILILNSCKKLKFLLKGNKTEIDFSDKNEEMSLLLENCNFEKFFDPKFYMEKNMDRLSDVYTNLVIAIHESTNFDFSQFEEKFFKEIHILKLFKFYKNTLKSEQNEKIKEDLLIFSKLASAIKVPDYDSDKSKMEIIKKISKVITFNKEDFSSSQTSIKETNLSEYRNWFTVATSEDLSHPNPQHITLYQKPKDPEKNQNKEYLTTLKIQKKNRETIKFNITPKNSSEIILESAPSTPFVYFTLTADTSENGKSILLKNFDPKSSLKNEKFSYGNKKYIWLVSGKLIVFTLDRMEHVLAEGITLNTKNFFYKESTNEIFRVEISRNKDINSTEPYRKIFDIQNDYCLYLIVKKLPFSKKIIRMSEIENDKECYFLKEDGSLSRYNSHKKENEVVKKIMSSIKLNKLKIDDFKTEITEGVYKSYVVLETRAVKEEEDFVKKTVFALFKANRNVREVSFEHQEQGVKIRQICDFGGFNYFIILEDGQIYFTGNEDFELMKGLEFEEVEAKSITQENHDTTQKSVLKRVKIFGRENSKILHITKNESNKSVIAVFEPNSSSTHHTLQLFWNPENDEEKEKWNQRLDRKLSKIKLINPARIMNEFTSEYILFGECELNSGLVMSYEQEYPKELLEEFKNFNELEYPVVFFYNPEKDSIEPLAVSGELTLEKIREILKEKKNENQDFNENFLVVRSPLVHQNGKSNQKTTRTLFSIKKILKESQKDISEDKLNKDIQINSQSTISSILENDFTSPILITDQNLVFNFTLPMIRTTKEITVYFTPNPFLMNSEEWKKFKKETEEIWRTKNKEEDEVEKKEEKEEMEEKEIDLFKKELEEFKKESVKVCMIFNSINPTICVNSFLLDDISFFHKNTAYYLKSEEKKFLQKYHFTLGYLNYILLQLYKSDCSIEGEEMNDVEYHRKKKFEFKTNAFKNFTRMYNWYSSKQVVTVNRMHSRTASVELQNRFLFNQLYNELILKFDKDSKLNKVPLLTIQFYNELGDDEGGVLRDMFTFIKTEFDEKLNLFIPTPNNQAHLGQDQDSVIPRPSLLSKRNLKTFFKLGVMMGIAYGCNELINIRLTKVFWKFVLSKKII